MHGELLQVRCTKNEEHIFNWHNDLDEKNKCEICNSPMRPNITWFGGIPMHMDKIYKLAEEQTYSYQLEQVDLCTLPLVLYHFLMK